MIVHIEFPRTKITQHSHIILFQHLISSCIIRASNIQSCIDGDVRFLLSNVDVNVLAAFGGRTDHG